MSPEISQQTLFGDGRPFGADGSRLHQDHVHAKRLELHPQAVAEPFESVLARVVPCAERLAELGAHRRDVDDPARLLRTHHRQGELGQPRETEQIDLELSPGIGERNVLEGPAATVAGVVDEDVQARRFRPDRVDRGNDRRVIRQVKEKKLSALPRERRHSVLPPGGGEHLESLLQQGEDGRRADARGRPRNQRGLAHRRAPPGEAWNFRLASPSPKRWRQTGQIALSSGPRPGDRATLWNPARTHALVSAVPVSASLRPVGPT